jgi:hypothetical protein
MIISFLTMSHDPFRQRLFKTRVGHRADLTDGSHGGLPFSFSWYLLKIDKYGAIHIKKGFRCQDSGVRIQVSG